MELLDLPVEIFKNIIHDVVREVGVVNAWRLRAVCRTFDQEIATYALSSLPTKYFRDRRAKRILEKNLGYYLAHRVYNPYDVRPELPNKVAKMAHFLNIELGAETKSQRWHILLSLCKGLASFNRYQYGNHHLLLLLRKDDGFDYSWIPEIEVYLQDLAKKFSKNDEAVAAVAVSNTQLVQKTLLQVTGDASSFKMFGWPLEIAVCMGDSVLLRTIMDVLGSKKTKMVKEQLVLDLSAFGAVKAAVKAIVVGRVSMLESVLKYLQAHVSLPSKQLYTSLLEHATLEDNVDCLKAVLAAVPNDRNGEEYVVSTALFRLACDTGHATSIAALIEEGNMDLASTTSEDSLMFIAIRSGQGSSVDAVLNAGADINLVVTSKRMKETLTPLEYAIRIKHLESVSRLLSRGATIPPVSKWPLSHLRIYSRIRDEKFRREGIRVIDYYGFRNLSTEARAAL